MDGRGTCARKMWTNAVECKWCHFWVVLHGEDHEYTGVLLIFRKPFFARVLLIFRKPIFVRVLLIIFRRPIFSGFYSFVCLELAETVEFVLTRWTLSDVIAAGVSRDASAKSRFPLTCTTSPIAWTGKSASSLAARASPATAGAIPSAICLRATLTTATVPHRFVFLLKILKPSLK